MLNATKNAIAALEADGSLRAQNRFVLSWMRLLLWQQEQGE